MAIQPVPAAPAALPFPGLNEKAAGTYNAAAFAWGNQMPAYADGIKALGDNVLNNATDAASSATNSAASAVVSTAQAALSQQAAMTAVNAPGSMATSSSSVALTPGVKNIVLDQLNKSFAKGQTLTFARTSAPATQATAMVLDFVPGTGVMQISLSNPTLAGTFTDWTLSVGAPAPSLTRLAYEDRAQLRSSAYFAGGAVLVDGLGLFLHALSSIELDDDESCFATPTGRWLLTAVDFELADSWLSSMAGSEISGRMLFGRAYSSVTTVGAGATTSFFGNVEGAEVGDRATVSFSKLLTSGTGFAHAIVTAPGIVTVQLCGGQAGMNSAEGNYYITVFKDN